MQKTITPIDNTIYVEREYHSDKIEQTIDNSMKAQKEWAREAKEINQKVSVFRIHLEAFACLNLCSALKYLSGTTSIPKHSASSLN